jgi:hypothetical protein
MAKITGPLVSLGARGTIGKTATYASWRGRAYVRQRVIPKNPRSTDQVANRTLFSFLQQMWKLSPTLVQDVWTLATNGTPKTNRNSFTQANILAIGFAAVDDSMLVMTNGAKGGPAPTSITLTPGANQIACATTNPTPPVGWTLVGSIWGIVKQQNPQTDDALAIVAAENDVSPYGHTFTGLDTGDPYIVQVWNKWTKPDGTTAYGVSSGDIATPT